MSILTKIFNNLSIGNSRISLAQAFAVPVRYRTKEKKKFVVLPEIGKGKDYRRRIHFPEKYTVEPLRTTNLGGRDPETGRRVCKGIGGGIKHKYHWIKWFRDGPTEGPPQEEKVIKIIKCGCRTADVALVAVQDEMKYILATVNMKAGDIIRTSRFIPRNPVRPNEGDAYPLRALPIGTQVHNVQLHPTTHYSIIHAAGTFGTVKRLLDDKVVVQIPSKREMLFEPECMATVDVMRRRSFAFFGHLARLNPDRLTKRILTYFLGKKTKGEWFTELEKDLEEIGITHQDLQKRETLRKKLENPSFQEKPKMKTGRISNVEHSSTPIGSAQRSRELGNRPRSGLWQRKTGRFGRKIKPIPRMKAFVFKTPKVECIQLSNDYFTP